MKVSRHVTNSTSLNVNGEDHDIELSQEPSSVMDYKDNFVSISPNGDLALFGYLVDDRDCENPLESSDGEGHIYSARRSSSREEIRGFQEALGLDSYFAPAIDEDEIFDRYEAYFVANMPIADCPEKIDERELEESDEVYLKRCAQVDYDHGQSKVVFPKALEEIRAALYREARNPLAVPLDVYEHSGVAYSVSGEGMQDRWDTSRGGAVWVPDDCAKENLEYQAVEELLPEGTSVAYISTPEKLNDITYTLPDGTKQGGFKNFVSAVRGAAEALGVPLDEATVLTKMQERAREYARGVAEEYTMWCIGETYGHVIDQYAKCDDGKWELTDSDSCYGYIGSDYAIQAMEEAAGYYVEKNIKQNSLTNAEKIAGSKSSFEIVDSAEAEGEFAGKVMDVTDRHAVISLGRNAVIVSQSDIDQVLSKDQDVVLKFSGGKGVVEPVKILGQGVER